MHDAATLRELMDYNPETGVLVWRHRPASYFSSDAYAKTWNAKHAGNPCGSLNNGYIRISCVGKNIQAHVAAWIIVTGDRPTHEIDHENGKRADNRWVNIRDIPHAENQINMPIKSNNTTGYPGVYRAKRGRWLAKIKKNRREIPLGGYATFEEAKAARVAAEIRLGFTVRIENASGA